MLGKAIIKLPSEKITAICHSLFKALLASNPLLLNYHPFLVLVLHAFVDIVILVVLVLLLLPRN